jgi:hypothetical protein
MRKISIKISLLNEENRHKKLVSRLRFRPNPATKWYKLVLPYWIIKEAFCKYIKYIYIYIYIGYSRLMNISMVRQFICMMSHDF